MSKFIPDSMMESIREVQYLIENHSVTSALCFSDPDLSPQDFLDVMGILQDAELYVCIYILLIKNQGNRVIGRAIDKFVSEILAEHWKRIGTNQLCQNLRKAIQDELDIHHNRATL